MQDIVINSFNANVRVEFGAPTTSTEAELPRRAKELLGRLSPYGINARDVTLENGDGLFGYALKATFLGGEGTTRLDVNQLEMELSDARTAADWETMAECFSACYDCLRLQEPTLIWITVELRTTFPNEQALDEFYGNAVRLPNGLELGMLQVTSEFAPFDFVSAELKRDYDIEGGLLIEWYGATEAAFQKDNFLLARDAVTDFARRFGLAPQPLSSP